MDIPLLLQILEIGVILVGAKVMWSINETIKTQKHTIDSQKALIDNLKSQSDIHGTFAKSLESALKFFDPKLLDSVLELHTKRIELEHQKKLELMTIIDDQTFAAQDIPIVKKTQAFPREIVPSRLLESSQPCKSSLANNYVSRKVMRSLEKKDDE